MNEKKLNVPNTVNCVIEHEVTNYDKFEQKCNELSNKLQEVKSIVTELENIELSIEFYQS